jgi:uncharacterized membrane protein YbhN (UPF0104 family)
MTAATTAEDGLTAVALRRRAAALGLLAVFVAALLASGPGGADALGQARHVSPAWIAVALALELASEVGFVIIFRRFFDCLPGRDARALAWTELGSGVLLPGGGAGGLAIGGWLMHLAGLPAGWVVRRSAGLFFLNAAVSGVALIGAGLALIAGAPGPHDFVRAVLPTAIALLVMLVVATLPATVRSIPRAPRFLRAIATGVREAQDITLRDRSWRVAGAVAYLVFDLAVLWVALRALGDPPSVPALMMAYSVGYLAASLPVPGGLGVLDAGLAGALVAYGASPVHATAAVLLYHTVALWVPGVGGLVAYVRVRARLLQRADTTSRVVEGGDAMVTNNRRGALTMTRRSLPQSDE